MTPDHHLPRFSHLLGTLCLLHACTNADTCTDTGCAALPPPTATADLTNPASTVSDGADSQEASSGIAPSTGNSETLNNAPSVPTSSSDSGRAVQTSTEESTSSAGQSPVPPLAHLGSFCTYADECSSEHCEQTLTARVCCAVECDLGEVCRDDGESCVTCEPGLQRCNDGYPETCSPDGRWTREETCSGDTPVCIATTGRCGSCTSGEVQCSDGSTLEVCNSSGAFEKSACPGTTPACLNGQCVQCIPSTRQCVGTTPQQCSDSGQWVTQAPCAGDEPICDSETGECKCAQGTFRCDGAHLFQCDATGTWTSAAMCQESSPICNAEAGRCECESGQRECRTGYAARYECVGGSWHESGCVAPTDTCHDGSCVECSPGSSPWCEDGNIRATCSQDGTAVSESCLLLCENGQCRDTRQEAGAVICDVDSGLVCNAGAVCCRRGTNTCIAAGESCPNPSGGGSPQTYACDDHDDCPVDQRCCYRSYPASNTSCRSTCDASMGSSEWLCDPEHPCDSGQECTGTLDWMKLSYCKNP